MTEPTSLIRLLHLCSPSLPTGAYSYSQGLEWAVEAGWVSDSAGLGDWLTFLADQSMRYVDIPLLTRMYTAIENDQPDMLQKWVDQLLAWRETSELRDEEQTRGRALATLLDRLEQEQVEPFRHQLNTSQLAGFAFAMVAWNIDLQDGATGYAWSWLENQALTAMKIIPLGQSDGQQLLVELAPVIAENVRQGLQLADEEIGGSAPAFGLACSLHETQYTRLYRS